MPLQSCGAWAHVRLHHLRGRAGSSNPLHFTSIFTTTPASPANALWHQAGFRAAQCTSTALTATCAHLARRACSWTTLCSPSHGKFARGTCPCCGSCCGAALGCCSCACMVWSTQVCELPACRLAVPPGQVREAAKSSELVKARAPKNPKPKQNPCGTFAAACTAPGCCFCACMVLGCSDPGPSECRLVVPACIQPSTTSLHMPSRKLTQPSRPAMLQTCPMLDTARA